MTETPTPRQRRRVLTDKMVAALPRKPKPYLYADPQLPGHGIRCRPTGPGSFTVVTRDPFGKQRWIKIGSTAELKIEEAREKARVVISRIRQGLDPFEPPPVKPDTVADVVATYLKRHVEARHLRSGDEVRRILTVYVLPHWRDRSFTEVRRSDVARLLDAVEDKHGPWIADAVLAQLRSAASWYASRHDDYVAPFVRNMRRVPSQERKRSRILDDDELRRVWAAAGEAGAFGGMVRMLLLCGQRRGKVAGLCWGDISPEGLWAIRTAAREKSTPGTLQLPEAALAIINAQPRLIGNPHVFAGQGAGATNNFSRAKEMLDKASGVTGWTIHDLRRTSRSLLSRAGVRPDISERVLGHAVAGVEGVYDRFHYRDEMAGALRRLAALIERIVNPPEGNNIVPLQVAVS